MAAVVAYTLPAAGMIAYAGSQWLLFLSFLTAGSAGSAGNLALAQAIAGPVFALTSLSLRQIWLTRPAKLPGYKAILASRCATTVIAVAAVWAIDRGFALHLERSAFYLVLAIKAQEAVADILHARLDSAEASHLVGILLAAKGAVISLLAVSWMAVESSVANLSWTIAVSISLFLLLEGVFTWLRGGRAQVARSAVPQTIGSMSILWVGLGNVIISVCGFLPRFVLDAVSTRETIALFVAAMIPSSALMLLATARAQASLLAFGRAAQANGGPAFARLLSSESRRLAALSLACCLALFAASSIIGPEPPGLQASVRTSAIVTLVMLPAVIGQFLSYAVLAVATYRHLVAINAIGLIAAAMAALPLITWQPIIGAAAVACLPSLVQSYCFLKVMRSYFGSASGAAAA